MKRLKEKLKLLKESDTNLQIFGATFHEYRLNEPISVEEFELLEQKYSCKFPEDYKKFITQIGNGGAGPYYGVFSIETEDHNHGFCSWEEGCLIGDLSKPFQHSQAWNAVDDFWDNLYPDGDISEEEEEQLHEEYEEEYEEFINEVYWSKNVMQGSIPICHQGCAIRNWLVVSGPLKGTIWVDYRSEEGGIAPVLNKKKQPMTFTEWYDDWLTEVCSQLNIN